MRVAAAVGGVALLSVLLTVQHYAAVQQTAVRSMLADASLTVGLSDVEGAATCYTVTGRRRRPTLSVAQ